MDDSNKGLFAIGGLLIGVLMLGFVLEMLPETAVASSPVIITQPPTKQPAAAKIERVQVTPTPLPTETPAVPPIVFDDVVPEADSPEISSEAMGACFSQYSRNRNQSENICLPEWYPADHAPRSTDQYVCLTNGGVVEWVPVRLFDGRNNQTVQPFGGCS